MIFYQPNLTEGVYELDKEESKHCLQVLRLKAGDAINVIDGKGSIAYCKISEAVRSICHFGVLEMEKALSKDFETELLIAPTKNMDRMEWLVEKLAEIGVDRVRFIKTRNSERKVIRIDRLERKVIAAIKQSGNLYKTELIDIQPFEIAISEIKSDQKFIAYLGDGLHSLIDTLNPKTSISLLIGPEGDFDPGEISDATERGFKPVSLGTHTLRTETAGLIACSAVNFINRF